MVKASVFSDRPADMGAFFTMQPPTEEELRLREARVDGAERAIAALKEASLDLERRAAQFDDDIKRIHDKQNATLRWTIGAIIGFGATLAAIGIVIVTGESAERRALDNRISDSLAGMRLEAGTTATAMADLAVRTRATELATGQSREAADNLIEQFAALQLRIDQANHRTDLTLGRLSENIDNIRSDFSYLVEGGGARTSFAGQIFIAVPYDSPDADRTGTFISDIDVSVLSAAGQLRAGTLRLVIPASVGTPRQRVAFSLSMQFLMALAGLIDQSADQPSDIGRTLLTITDVDSLLTRFYETDAWPALAQAVADGHLTDFTIDQRPIVGE